ncbi:hypothetical protein COO60DRAFT_1639067 [Scenedesmus sp. NREL 46B-D3]|nr:hypothetical protein COO60DRAFT_1639067 [Scenedesmus sp. NREL 46B-D3]
MHPLSAVATKWGLTEHVKLLQELDCQLQGQQLDASKQVYVPGDLRWEALCTGDPSKDWPLLQEVSCANPNVFWAAVARELGLQQGLLEPPSCMLQEQHEQPDRASWLPGARLNIAACALTSPRAPGPDSPAIIWADEGAPTQLQRVSRAELQQRCMHVAACVAAKYKPGDALAIAMPLTLEAAVIYFGIVLAGCVVVSIADSFAAAEVATRLRIAGADVVVRGGKALPLYSRVVGDPAAPPAVVVPAAGASAARLPLRQGDVLWAHFLRLAGPSSGSGAARALPHVVPANAHSNILFSSGTTGEPKAIPWTHTTPLRCAVDGWSLQDIQPGSVVAWPTNLGWMMGPWLLYAALLNGASIALYQGSPLGRDFGEFVAAARVNVLGLVPSIVKAWRSSGCMSHLDWGSLRCFSSTGEASSPDDCHWLASRVTGYRPVIEYCGGTEIGGGFLAGCLLQPQVSSAFSTPTLGASLVLLSEDGSQHHHTRSAAAVTGELALVPPMLGMSQQLLHRDHAATYYGGMPACQVSGKPLRRHGDEAARLLGGYYRALGRVDDTMNLGGIKVSSVELERVVLANVPGVAEAAAVGAAAPGGGPELLHLFLVPSPNAAHAAAAAAAAAAGSGSRSSAADEAAADAAGQLRQACQAALRAHLNPLFKVQRVLLVPSLPRTASNKVMRRVLRAQAMQQRARL